MKFILSIYKYHKSGFGFGGEGTWPDEGHLMSPEVYFDGGTFQLVKEDY